MEEKLKWVVKATDNCMILYPWEIFVVKLEPCDNERKV